MIISLEISNEEADEFLRFMYYKKACADLRPEINPVDVVCLRIAQSIVGELRRINESETKL